MTRRVESQYDVVVVGGGAAGVASALGAAKAGAKVCLIEKYGFLGGAAVNAQVAAYCGLYQQGAKPVTAVAGVVEEVAAAMGKLGLDVAPHHSEKTGNWIVLLDPEILKLALDRVLVENCVDVLLHTRAAAATRTAQAIESVTLAGMDGRFRVVADAYVDASGDANLALITGVPFRLGDYEGRLQAATLPIRIGGVDHAVEINREAVSAAIVRHNATSALRLHRLDGGIFARLPVSGDLWWQIVDVELADLSSRTFSGAETRAREMARTFLELLRNEIAGFEHAYIAATGPQVGVRESRHPRARYEINGQDALDGRMREDGIARAAWPVELHNKPGMPVYSPIGGDGYFHVAYDAIRAKDVDNLWYAGRTIGADPVAYGSIRVMGTAFATGQAAGVAAALHVQSNGEARVEDIRARLLKQGAII